MKNLRQAEILNIVQSVDIETQEQMLEGLKDLDTVPVFLIDIDMPEVNGFEVTSFLKKWNRECCIGFVSNKDELVFQAFAYHPFFFIRKTHLDEELEPQLLELQKTADREADGGGCAGYDLVCGE